MMTKSTGNEVKGKAAAAAPDSPYAKEIAATAAATATVQEPRPVEVDTKVVEHQPEPQDPPKPKEEEEEPVVFFAPNGAEMRFVVKPSDVVSVGGIRKRDPGCVVPFRDCFAKVYPSRLYYNWGGTKITGAQIIEMMREAPFFGNTFKEFRAPDTKGRETADQMIGRLSMLAFDEVKAEARKLHLRFDPEATREGVILEIVKATCK
jgi:hypothetical protein